MLDPQYYAPENRLPYDGTGDTVPGHAQERKLLLLTRFGNDTAMVRRVVKSAGCDVAPVSTTGHSRTNWWLAFPDGPLEKYVSTHDIGGATLWSRTLDLRGRGHYDLPDRNVGPGTVRGLLEHPDERLIDIDATFPGEEGRYVMLSQSEIRPALSQQDMAAEGLDPNQVLTLNGRSLVIRALGVFGLPNAAGISPPHKNEMDGPVTKPGSLPVFKIPVPKQLYYLLPPFGWWPNGMSVDTSGVEPALEELPNPCGELRGWESLVYHGPRDEKYRITILGDGFTETEQTKFIDWSDTLVRALRCTEPFRSNWECLDIDRVFAVSRSSGVTGCPCGCDERCTYFGCRGNWPTEDGGDSYAAYIGTPYPERIRHAANLPPGGVEACHHLIVVLVNCPVAGGSAPPDLGYSFVTLGDSPGLDMETVGRSFVDIAMHEMAHIAAPLAEEYIGCAPEEIPDLGTFPLVDADGNPVMDESGTQIVLNLDIRMRDELMNRYWLRYRNMGFQSDETLAQTVAKWDQSVVRWFKMAETAGHVSGKRFRMTWDYRTKYAPMYSDIGDVVQWPGVAGDEPHWPTDGGLDIDQELGLFFGCQNSVPTDDDHTCDFFNDPAARNFFRPMTRCKMRLEAYDFCAVCRRAIERAIRRGCR